MRAFRYAPGSSFLHSLNPSIKLLAIVVVTVAVTFVLDIATPTAFLVLTLAVLVLLGGISPGYVVRGLSPFVLLALSFVVINSIFHRDLGPMVPLFVVGPLVVSREGVELGLSIGLRVLVLITTSFLFVATTEPGDFVLSLVQQAKINYRLAFAILAAYRFIPIFATEYANIRAAARVRGVGASEGLIGRTRALKRNAVPLLAGAIRRSERLAVAMDSRAFGAYPDRTYHRRLRVEARDWLFLAAVVIVTIVLLISLSRAGV